VYQEKSILKWVPRYKTCVNNCKWN
jgi:hypothetical protein